MNWYEAYGIKNPYYADEAVCIIHADCREILPLIPDKSIDLVLDNTCKLASDMIEYKHEEYEGRKQKDTSRTDMDSPQARDRMAVSPAELESGENSQLLQCFADGNEQSNQEARNTITGQRANRNTKRQIQKWLGEHPLPSDDREGQMLSMFGDAKPSDTSQELQSSGQSPRESSGALRELPQQSTQKAVVANSKIVLITDPPFNVRSEDWDTFTEEAFKSFTRFWMRNGYRIANILICFFADKYIPLLREVAVSENIPYRRALLWRKPPGSQYAGASLDGFWFDFEIIQVFGKPVNPKREATDYAVMDFRTITGQNHGCEKPPILIQKLIEHYSDTNDLILDPFLGSGTTAVAAKKLGRKCIGIEIEERYAHIAAERCRQMVLPLEIEQVKQVQSISESLMK